MSKLFHLTIGRMISILTGLFYQTVLLGLEDGEHLVQSSTEYISQLSGARKSTVSKFYGEIGDKEAAKRFGTDDLKLFSYWAWRACGIVCLQMVLKSSIGNSFVQTTMDLVNRGVQLNGYSRVKDNGWLHSTLVTMSKEFGIDAKKEKFVSLDKIAYYISRGKYVMLAIKSKTGGHFFLVYGIRTKNGKTVAFLVHDPYDYEELGKSKELTYRELSKLSTRRIIVF